MSDLDILCLIYAEEAGVAAWVAHIADRPMSWLDTRTTVVG